MSRVSFFQDIVGSLFEQTNIFRTIDDGRSTLDLCEALLSEKGEVSGSKLAAALLSKYDQLDPKERRDFFIGLADEFDLDTDQVVDRAERYAEDRSAPNLAGLLYSAEPRRQELLRRLNQIPGATEKLVRMREDLLPLLRENPHLARVDADFQHLFSSWFNRGFLVMRPIDWKTPANILEKIIDYEAVHAINDWADLRSRLEPEDRRCYAFFHPAMPEEPLIFVEVALTRGTPDSIGDVLGPDIQHARAEDANTAVFYSISNCQAGLKGVSFGSFLIKQVANDLSQDLRKLSNFVTLSPIPGFSRWLNQQAAEMPDHFYHGLPTVDDAVENPGEALVGQDKALKSAVAKYLLDAKDREGKPLDPVARFHLGNGASLLRINWLADLSERGMGNSYGMMVNYLYDLGSLEANHEAYTREHEVKTTREIRNLARARKAEQA